MNRACYSGFFSWLLFLPLKLAGQPEEFFKGHDAIIVGDVQSLADTKERVEHEILPGSNERVGYFGRQPGVPVVCNAGSIAVFSSTSFHRSSANTTDRMRRVYSIQYSPEPVLEPDGSLKGLAEPFLENGRRVR